MFKSSTIFIFCTVLLCGCVDPEEVVINNADLYFDLPSYVEVVKNDFQNLKISKKVVLNDKTESKEISDYNMSEELDMMASFDINKPSMSGKYETQETTTEINNTVTSYTAKEEDLKTQRLEIVRFKNEISEIKIMGSQKTILSENNQTIIFAPEKSFHLVSEDKNRFGKKLRKEILITFNN